MIGIFLPQGVRPILKGLLASLFFVATVAHGQLQPVPPITDYVTDLGDMISTGAEAGLREKLRAFEKEKGAQVIIVTVQTTLPETIEQYTLRIAEAAKIGRKGVDDGVVLAFARNDRTVRIEVGYGLEGAIPDLKAKRIIDQMIVPAFRSGNFDQGFERGVDGVLALIRGEELPAVAVAGVASHDYGQIGFLTFIVALVCSQFASLFVRRPYAETIGTAIGFTAGLIQGPFFLAILVSLFAYVVLLGQSAAALGGGGNFYGGRSGRSGGGFDGFSGGFSGGFGGGGGSFGGGGASGRW